MKKLTHSLGMATVTIFLLLSVIGCGKESVSKQSDPPVVNQPSEPSLSLKSARQTAWYNGSDTVLITSNAQSVIRLETGEKVIGGKLIISRITGDSIVTVVATNMNSVGSKKNNIQSITLHNFSQRMTWFWNQSYLKMEEKHCNAALIGLPGEHWENGPEDLRKYQFSVDFSVQQIDPDGNHWNTPTAYIINNNETEILFTGESDSWHFDTISPSGFTIWKNVPDLFGGPIVDKVVRTFIKVN